MRILLVNDDGIHAPGLKALGDIARQLSDDVWTVAPESDQSGVSHSLSLNDPLRLRQIDEKTYAVKGTPTDCVVMAVRHIMTDTPPDLVLSGINRGQNAAEDSPGAVRPGAEHLETQRIRHLGHRTAQCGEPPGGVEQQDRGDPRDPRSDAGRGAGTDCDRNGR